MDVSTAFKGLVKGKCVNKRYTIIDLLGSGASGAVFLAEDNVLNDELVALKFLNPEFILERDLLARFRNEALYIRGLEHENVVKFIDLRVHRGNKFFMVLEYIEGCSLKQYLKKEKPLSLKESLNILYRIASGLSAAHEIGIVHRDLKPGNILIGNQGELKLVDFGLAKDMGSDEHLTATGETVGTPNYMSPEQIRARNIDHRTDIYALGVIAYEMITGKKPFRGANYLATAAKHLKEPVPKFALLNSGIPRWYQSMVERCMAKDADERFQSVSEITELIAPHIGIVRKSSFTPMLQDI